MHQGEYVAVADHRPDQAVGGFLIDPAARCDGFELVTAARRTHRQAGGERGEVDGLSGGVGVSQHRLRGLQSAGEIAFVHRHRRPGCIDDEA